MLLLDAVHTDSSFKALLHTLHLFIILVTLHNMVTWYVDILNLLLWKFTSIENQTF